MTLWRTLFTKRLSSQAGKLPPDEELNKMRGTEYNGNMKPAVDFIEDLLGVNDDLVIRSLRVFTHYDAVLIYFSNLVNREVINDSIVKPLMNTANYQAGKKPKRQDIQELISKDIVFFGQIHWENNIPQAVEALLRGDTLVFMDDVDKILCISTRNVEHRGIEQPQTEQAVRGSRDGFIESMATNITLLRYRLQTPNFRIKMQTLGRLSKTKVGICYIEGIVNPALVEEVERRLNSIDVDVILDAGTIEQYVEDNHWSPFPQLENSERPDKCVSNLCEGRVVLLIDGTPFALIAPAVFTQFYQTVDDYSERPLMGSLIRMVRVVALLFSLVFPGIYVAVISFNPELIPTQFAVAIAGARAGVPFPAVVEVLIMEISMEVLREATLRLPQQVGGALSIVGVLVIGQAAVAAGFVSPITVVIIALTTIGSFATPAYNAAVAMRILRFLITILGGIFGLYGVVIGMIVITNHMLSLRSFGVPYMSPIVPVEWQGWKDALMRAPIWWMPVRPQQVHPQNNRRLGKGTLEKVFQRPHHPLDPVDPKGDRQKS
ncbi:spore germination protein [Alicyclobacillus sp. SO9]|uniref:spore germination protein n=1 Tax=Alicyclobacillus sp. SO9 TaxID=2665646 RepID=UPI001E415DA6|nr:spore germination protein [Alicyclobacillus sp. SO9]